MTQFKIVQKVEGLCEKLAKEIRKKYEEDRIQIVALAKGGLVPARYLAKCLGIKRIYSIGIEYYSDVNQTFEVPYVYQKLTNDFKEKDIILIVDDIVDSGKTMGVAMQEIIDHKGKHVLGCSLHYKSKSTYTPDYYGEEVPDEVWVIYPWEKDESTA